MTLVDVLYKEKINVEQLQKGLKHIGLDLSKFDSVQNERITDLIELFKIAVDVDPHKTTKFIKMDLRVKLEKVIKNREIDKPHGAVVNLLRSKKPVIVPDIKQNPQLASIHKNQPPMFSGKRKLGRVKFFDDIKGFGYLHSFDDNKDCFVHVSKILTSSVDEDDIVSFETVDSRKKPGELDAIRVSCQIPVFILNKESSAKSFVFPLLEGHVRKEIPLTDKFDTGFKMVTANQSGSSWKVISAASEQVISHKDIVYYGKKILGKLLENPKDNKATIENLTTVIKQDISGGALDTIYRDSVNSFEQKSVSEIKEGLGNFRELEYFEQYIIRRKSFLNKISFVLWDIGELESLPKASNQLEVDIWISEILPGLDSKALQTLILKMDAQGCEVKQIRATYEFLVLKGWIIKTPLELQSVSDFLKTLIAKFPEIMVSEKNFIASSSDTYIQLYKDGILGSLTSDRFKQYIEAIDSDDARVAFLGSLPMETAIELYSFYPKLSTQFDNYMFGILDEEFSKIDYLCFDLESDGQNISEYAWKTPQGSKSDVDFKNHEDGIVELMGLLNSETLVVGQNIKTFDLEIMSSHGVVPSNEFIWDTLEIEMLLNPERFSYGLKTQHNAAFDTELTFRLFKNQLSRIITSSEEFENIKKLLPLKAIDIINLVSRNPLWTSLNYSFFEKQSNGFFRPNPTNQSLSEKAFLQVKEKMGQEGNKVLIAPEFLWNTLSNQFDLSFYSDDKANGFFLSKEKIETILDENKLLKYTLLRFVDLRKGKGIRPYYKHLPIALRLKLTDEQVNQICDYVENDFRNLSQRPICIKPSEIEVLKKRVSDKVDFQVIVIGKELYDLTSKVQLGQDLDFVAIFDRLKNEPIWLQMSGGKSFISLEKNHCTLLGILEFPENIQNIWLEKIGKGKFKVWCNLNFGACLDELSVKEIIYINWVDESSNKTNSFIVRPDARRSGYIAEQKRVNPESLYRKIYWVYQFKLFNGLGNAGNPKVLIVNDGLELDRLSAYSRRMGYFIPDVNASMARQVELLHANKSPRKLLITTFADLDKIISWNYTGPLDFIWDSFLLQEKMQMFKGKIALESQSNEDQKEEDYQMDASSNQKNYDLFSLIKLHKPLIDYYYKMLIDNNSESQLFLCDTRLTDYYGIEKSLNVDAENIQMWYKESEYDVDKKLAAEFFPSVNENSDIDFNIDEAKEILRSIFLIPEEGGAPYQWHDYQHPCLDEILPAKKDLLISLPTGAGKSLLFQGPALFRSAFSCKLSIVISPLRALMQDQVDALWRKGFYSNVEFLSGDKSHYEIRDIYRRVSGGEITLLYITPERFRSRSFENSLLSRLDADSGLEYVVFDEAHCISQWGQEFRPDYLNAGRKIAEYSDAFHMRKLLFSATISEQVFNEISILMPGVATVEGTEKSYNPVRDHINMDFKHNVDEDDRLLEIANYLKNGKFNPKLSRAIVFVKSRKQADECELIIADSLKEVFGATCSFSEKVGAFHAGMDAEDRRDVYDKFKTGEIVLLFATKAFGMGMDIPNIHFVTHHSPPGTFEDFLQEVGRAGRNEAQRLAAGFNTRVNPISTICLTTNNDFAKLKDQLHKSRISWHEVKDIKDVLETHMARFKPLIPDNDIPVAIPFNLYTTEQGIVNEELDNKFRIALHWLERLERIRLGYFTITHLEFESASLKQLAERVDKCPDQNSEKACRAILELIGSNDLNTDVVQISIASLRNISKLSLQNLFTALLKAHSCGILKLLQEVVIVPTNLRADELKYFANARYADPKYPALKVLFSFARSILERVPANDSRIFEGEDLDELLKESIVEHIRFMDLPWPVNPITKSGLKTVSKYREDILKKRSKHAFTIIRLLGKTKHETKMEKVADSHRKVKVSQSIFNGYHKKDEWLFKIQQLEKDCVKLLDYVSKKYFDKNIKSFNWPDLITELDLKGNVQYLSDLLFILSVLGYCKTGGLLPSGIEVYLNSIEPISETDLQSIDKKIFDEFEETRKVRELKLIALEVLASFHKNNGNNDPSVIRKKQDSFIRKYFACNSLGSLLQLLQDELPPNDPLLIKWRGDAIKAEEDRLNPEQRKVYDAQPNQNISVMAGPGSGKTHTLTLRVARLVHEKGIQPEEILVLAYNRAVVSELKERLGKLFNDLGYGNLAKRIMIFTFHGLAKKYCLDEVKDKPFDEWKMFYLINLIVHRGKS